MALAGSIFHALSPLIERNHQWHLTSKNGINCPRLSVSAATSNASATKSGAKTSQSSSRLSSLSGLSLLSFALLQKPLLLRQARLSRFVTQNVSAPPCKV